MKIFVVVVEPNCYSLLTVVSIPVWFVNCDHTDVQLVPVAEIMTLWKMSKISKMDISLNSREVSGQILIGVGFVFVNLQQRNILLNNTYWDLLYLLQITKYCSFPLGSILSA